MPIETINIDVPDAIPGPQGPIGATGPQGSTVPVGPTGTPRGCGANNVLPRDFLGQQGPPRPRADHDSRVSG